MTQKRTSNSRGEARRQLLKTLGISSGIAATSTLIPRTWTKPIVESVMLPAHALTSPPPCEFSSFTSNSITFTHCSCGTQSATLILYYSLTIAPSLTLTIAGPFTTNPNTVQGVGSIQAIFTATDLDVGYFRQLSGTINPGSPEPSLCAAPTSDILTINDPTLATDGNTVQLNLRRVRGGEVGQPIIAIDSFVVTDI